MLIGNLNCIFLNEDHSKGFFEYWNEFAYHVFDEGIEFPNNHKQRYMFLEVSKHRNLENEPVIIGKFVKITVLDVDQEYKDGKLINVKKHYPTAPSSIFIYLIRSHILLFLHEHKGSPSIRNFTKYFDQRLDIERISYVNSLLNNGEKKDIVFAKYPKADIDYTGIISLTQLSEIFKQIHSISDLHIITKKQNGELDIDGFVGDNQSLLEKLKAKKSDIKISNVKSVDGVKEVVSHISSNGAAEFKFVATLSDGNKKQVQNQDIQLESVVNYNPQNSVLDNSKVLIKKLHSLVENKEIPAIQTTVSPETIESVFEKLENN